jgi:hypothetical protein
METEDVHLATVPVEGQDDTLDLLLIDPMPGGSGLLQQLIESWPSVIEAATEVVSNCPSDCATSCTDCLQSYRNQQYHAHLDRLAAKAFIEASGGHLVVANSIPAKIATAQTLGENTHQQEDRLNNLLDRAGLPPNSLQNKIELTAIATYTVPDAYFDCENEAFEGICVYLDGLSKGIHGNPAVAARDQLLRSTLEELSYKVVVIPKSDLEDRGAMINHFAVIARSIQGKSRANQVRDTSDRWWTDA